MAVRTSLGTRRLDLCPAKNVLSQLNPRLQADGMKAVSGVGLAREIRRAEIAGEMATLINEIEEQIRATQ